MNRIKTKKTLQLKLNNLPKELPLSSAKSEFIIDCKARKLSSPTILNYSKSIDYFIDFIGDINLYEITDSDVKRWMISLHEKNAINSVRSYIKNIKYFFKYFNIIIDVKNPREQKKILECYTDEEVRLLLTKPKYNSFGRIRDYTIVCFLLSTGVRTSTLINIKVTDADLKAKTLFLRKTKTQKQYTIPLSSTLCSVLAEYLDVWNHNPDDYLFPSAYGDQLSPPALRQLIYSYHKQRGIKSFSVHKYRRTFASNYLKSCNNVFFLQQLLGHSDISTTRRYCSINIEDLQNNFDAYNPLDNTLKKSIKLIKPTKKR